MNDPEEPDDGWIKLHLWGLMHAAGWYQEASDERALKTRCGHWFYEDVLTRYRMPRGTLVTCLHCVVQGLKG